MTDKTQPIQLPIDPRKTYVMRFVYGFTGKEIAVSGDEVNFWKKYGWELIAVEDEEFNCDYEPVEPQFEELNWPERPSGERKRATIKNTYVREPFVIEIEPMDDEPVEQAAQGWRPIESAPKEERRIMGLTNFGPETVIWRAASDNGLGWWHEAGYWGCEQDSTCRPVTSRNAKPINQPTRWQHLPKPPAGDKK